MAENMIKAGRAGLTFGGDWDETVEYNRLVGVRYDNKLFFSKKAVPVGTIPEDGQYWFLAYEGLTDAEWEAILDGTQQVGDSAKLGGETAKQWQGKIDKINSKTGRITLSGAGWYRIASRISSSNEITSIFDIVLNARLYQTCRVRYSSEELQLLSAVTTRTPIFKKIRYVTDTNGNGYIDVYADGNNACMFEILDSLSLGTSATTDYSWYAIKDVAVVDETAERETVQAVIDIPQNATPTTNTDLANYLPLSGGTVGVNSSTPLIIKRGNLDNVKIQFDGQTGTLGSFGFTAIDKPVYVPSTGSGAKDILHTGNKPTGTYTGNGNDTERTINIGGVGVSVLMIQATNVIAFVGYYGAVAFDISNNVTKYFPRSAYNFDKDTGLLTIATNDSLINSDGKTFYYGRL